MKSSGDKHRMIRRAAREIQSGMTVNLGIGLPTKVIEFMDTNQQVCLHSENGIAGVGPVVTYDKADRNLIDAGGGYVSTLPGTAFFDSALSFALVRGGHLDLTIMGALQVAANGDLANWSVPGKFTPGVGGATELAQKARRVVILTTHVDKWGKSKIVEQCSLPLTAANCVNRICTDLAVLDVINDSLILIEIAQGVSVDEVLASTDAPLQVPDHDLPTF